MAHSASLNQDQRAPSDPHVTYGVEAVKRVLEWWRNVQSNTASAVSMTPTLKQAALQALKPDTTMRLRSSAQQRACDAFRKQTSRTWKACLTIIGDPENDVQPMYKLDDDGQIRMCEWKDPSCRLVMDEPQLRCSIYQQIRSHGKHSLESIRKLMSERIYNISKSTSQKFGL